MIARRPGTEGARRCSIGVLVAAFASCGGRTSNEPGSVGTSDASAVRDAESAAAPCGPFAACGGDVVGHWTVDSQCYDSNVNTYGCERLAYHTVACSGAFDFDDGGAFSLTTTCVTDYTADLTGNCLSPVCDQGMTQAADGTHFDCVADAAACRCEVSGSDTVAYTGTYGIDGSTLTLVPGAGQDAGGAIIYDYCADAGGLVLHVAVPGTGVSLSRP